MRRNGSDAGRDAGVEFIWNLIYKVLVVGYLCLGRNVIWVFLSLE